MISATTATLEELIEVMNSLPAEVFTRPCDVVGGATIGQHVRHTIELYQCLLSGYTPGDICYDKRARDKKIENDVDFALHCLHEISGAIGKPDKDLNVSYEIDHRGVQLRSNYYREVMYNLEHTIHHQALIRVAIESLTSIKLPVSFGVAPSTLKYRATCAQ